MKKSIIAIAALAVFASACSSTKVVTDTVVKGEDWPTVDDRQSVAARTCETQAEEKKEYYLSAIQTLVANKGTNAGADAAASRAPLDNFREEVNVAYRTIVNRCRAYIQCMENNGYDEGRCVLANAYYREAERDFSELSYRLANIQRELLDSQLRNKKKGPSIVIDNTQTQENSQTQRNDQDASAEVGGDYVDDRDIVRLCGADNLLDRQCREPCNDGDRCKR